MPSVKTSYSEAINRFQKKDRRLIEGTLGIWGVTQKGRVIVPNLQQMERFLSPDRTAALLKTVLLHCTSPIETLNAAYQKECYRHVGKGKAVKMGKLPHLVGRVVGRKLFIKSLLNAYPKYFYTESNVEGFVKRLLLGGLLKPGERMLLMSRHLAWVTFNPDLSSSGAGNPFSFLKSNRAEEVKACLGLDPKMGKRVLLLISRVPKNAELFRPTIADAGLFEFFSPPPPGEDKHGWTKPWQPQFLSAALNGIPIEPRPEALHKPWVFDVLKLPIEELA